MVNTDTRQRILAYLSQKGSTGASSLAEHLGLSTQAVHRQLNRLLETKQLKKLGKPPQVQYFLLERSLDTHLSSLDSGSQKLIDARFMQVTPDGNLLQGVPAFNFWCAKFKLDTRKTAAEYLKTFYKYERFRKDGLIEGTDKLKYTFPKVYIDHLYYMDFYAIERFGKTRLGLMLLLAKQSQSKIFIQKLKQEVKAPILALLKRFRIDGIAFVPPSVKRQTQIMKELNKAYGNLAKPISIKRLSGDIVVPQKSLSKLADRVANVHNGFIVSAGTSVKNLLLVDDALGSGATLNEIAHIVKSKKLCNGKIYALAITGSPKGFEVIQEV